MRSQSLITLNEPHSMVAESYKMFRTNLSYMNVDKDNKVILFTSSTTEEGKTTSISNAAVSLAQSGKKVLLVECDLRKARIHTVFDIPQTPGLTNVLAEKKPLSGVVTALEELPNLHVLTSGVLPPDPAETLNTQALATLIEQARNSYDVILLDAPPVLAVTDALILCKQADGVILIVASGESKKDDARKAKKALEKVGAKIMGAVLTKVQVSSKAHYYYYGNKAE